MVSLGLLKLAFGSLEGIGQASSRTHESLPQGPVYQRGDDSLGVEFKLVGGLGFQFLANVKKFRKNPSYDSCSSATDIACSLPCGARFQDQLWGHLGRVCEASSTVQPGLLVLYFCDILIMNSLCNIW